MSKATSPPPSSDPQVNRLIWRSRRGMLELELVLKPFVEGHLAALSPAGQALYARLLDHDDWDIFDWIQGRDTPADPEIGALVADIRAANTA